MVKLTDAHTRYEMGKKAQQAGNQFTWASRGEEIYAAITKATKEKGIK